MEVEFLIPERAAEQQQAIPVNKLHVQAQPLRHVGLAYDRSMIVKYCGLNVRVGEPEVFCALDAVGHPKAKREREDTKGH